MLINKKIWIPHIWNNNVLWHREVIVSLENNTSQTATDHNVTSQLQLQLNSALSKAKFSEKHSPSHTINKYTADLQM